MIGRGPKGDTGHAGPVGATGATGSTGSNEISGSSVKVPAVFLMTLCVVLAAGAIGVATYAGVTALGHADQIQSELQAACERNNDLREHINEGIIEPMGAFMAESIRTRRAIAGVVTNPKVVELNRRAANRYVKVLQRIAVPFSTVDCAALYPPL